MYYKVNFKEPNTYKTILEAYSLGIFPMGSNYLGDDIIEWFYSDPRGIIKLESDFKGIKISRSLKQVLKKNIFEVKIDTNFEQVIKGCAARQTTWINKKIIELYTELHKKGYAHSIETYKDNKLVGGLYGVAYRGAFFGESMFHIYPNASKVAFIKLYQILTANNYLLLDIQMITSLFLSFGAIYIPFSYYLNILKKALEEEREFKY
ncbi:MAG: leucyl/phenylalanyl-tRNA--protein transferase [Ignavibacteria bacterium]|nr:leucyl/phenylalanyl-tRNA--protein transferase [Ignavibacteria bacterium]